MSVQNNHFLPSSQRGSILVYAVLIIVFFAGLAVFLRGSSTPVFSHIADTRHQYEVEYLLDSVNHILNNHLLSESFDLNDSIKVANCLNEMKTFKIGTAIVTRINSGISISEVKPISDLGVLEKIVVEDVDFKIELEDGTVLSRSRTLHLRVN